jgi:hypothetical protein
MVTDPRLNWYSLVWTGPFISRSTTSMPPLLSLVMHGDARAQTVAPWHVTMNYPLWSPNLDAKSVTRSRENSKSKGRVCSRIWGNDVAGRWCRVNPRRSLTLASNRRYSGQLHCPDRLPTRASSTYQSSPTRKLTHDSVSPSSARGGTRTLSLSS